MALLRQHTTDRSSSDRLALLEAAVAHMATSAAKNSTRLDSLERRDSEQQQWNDECQARVEASQQQMATRTCPNCQQTYPDGWETWPGYTSKTHPGDPRCAKCFPKDAALCLFTAIQPADEQAATNARCWING